MGKTNIKLSEEESKLYTKYPHVFFYEKINGSQKKIELDTQTEKKVDDLFKMSIITNHLKPNDTRINNTLMYLKDNFIESSNGFELIKKKNNNNTYSKEYEFNNLILI